MDMGDLGKEYDGIAKLAMVGAGAIVIVFVGSVAGLVSLAWWAWNHVSIH